MTNHQPHHHRDDSSDLRELRLALLDAVPDPPHRIDTDQVFRLSAHRRGQRISLGLAAAAAVVVVTATGVASEVFVDEELPDGARRLASPVLAAGRVRSLRNRCRRPKPVSPPVGMSSKRRPLRRRRSRTGWLRLRSTEQRSSGIASASVLPGTHLGKGSWIGVSIQWPSLWPRRPRRACADASASIEARIRCGRHPHSSGTRPSPRGHHQRLPRTAGRRARDDSGEAGRTDAAGRA